MTKLSLGKICFCAIAISVFLLLGIIGASADTIIDEWSKVQAPKPPELKSVTVDPKTTALLVLDIAKQTCNQQRRPRCIASVPKIQAFLNQARTKGLSIVYSLGSSGTPADVLIEVARRDEEPIVQSSVDKFFKTDLEKILKEKGIKTVIVVGTAAQGAVLYTGSGAALRGMQVILPVDGISADITYYEQYVAYHMTTAPGVSQRVTLTKFDMIK